jgi:AraC-like DNA-binding protein
MNGDVRPVRYRPHDDAYRLDVEVIGADELRRRVASEPRRGFERVDFQCVLFVRSGTYSHTIDFETHQCTAGSCLLIGPGQVHRFGPSSNWDGWLLIVRSHDVPTEIDRLPPHIRAEHGLAAVIAELLARMATDASPATDPSQRNELLVLQAQLLARRLVLGHASSNPVPLIDPMLINRYREYRAVVDQEFRRWHLVTPYAQHLGWSTKSLNRACRATADVTAKRVIVERIVLEAKRLLAHGSDPVAEICSRLGFDEPTNFVKYFKRETGLTPTQFRSSPPAVTR